MRQVITELGGIRTDLRPHLLGGTETTAPTVTRLANLRTRTGMPRLRPGFRGVSYTPPGDDPRGWPWVLWPGGGEADGTLEPPEDPAADPTPAENGDLNTTDATGDGAWISTSPYHHAYTPRNLRAAIRERQLAVGYPEWACISENHDYTLAELQDAAGGIGLSYLSGPYAGGEKWADEAPGTFPYAYLGEAPNEEIMYERLKNVFRTMSNDTTFSSQTKVGVSGFDNNGNETTWNADFAACGNQWTAANTTPGGVFTGSMAVHVADGDGGHFECRMASFSFLNIESTSALWTEREKTVQFFWNFSGADNLPHKEGRDIPDFGVWGLAKSVTGKTAKPATGALLSLSPKPTAPQWPGQIMLYKKGFSFTSCKIVVEWHFKYAPTGEA